MAAAIPSPTTDIVQAQSLRLNDVYKSYGNYEAVRGISIDVPKGSMVSLIGPSGCGKTTTLRMIAGLEPLSGGSITAGSKLLSDATGAVPPERRDMGMVFQSYALWPHMSVADNVGYGLKRKGLNGAEIERRVSDVLSMVGMAEHVNRYPSQLSGGQQQRVALARAVASRPQILLFDEPLSNLDAVLREQMRFEIRDLQQKLGITSVYVTHSQEEALALSDKIVVMNKGLVVQSGTPSEIYERPKTAFVAGFIGLTNTLTLNRLLGDDQTAVGSFGEHRIKATGAALHGKSQQFLVSLRPSEITLSPASAAPTVSMNRLVGTIQTVVFTGGIVDYFIACDGAAQTMLRVQTTPPARFEPGVQVAMDFDPARTVVLEDQVNGTSQ
ncbi:ABC transporter ATP-binding protein [Rhizobium sp. EC-SD404]|uniref:ABC transporter ATP-binding protein n=1 Tax=Rhizobium sp. EC-SD404 TaxID=2038389 RepID=UPI0012589F0D|nr:ABC transporter ATP-binding protein [Rhizobium sp. EC-SD404]VVT05120.1 Spermidine/putrescine import ATP-binding protein PotA [Rhizobium sp. EC-SD404]